LRIRAIRVRAFDVGFCGFCGLCGHLRFLVPAIQNTELVH
jgi:hypothetical protein